MMLHSVSWLGLLAATLFYFIIPSYATDFMQYVSLSLTAAKEFDYVIIGGGQAGLVVASRLSEDPSLQVAVIEAGPSGLEKENAPKIDVPAANLYNSPGQSPMNWNWTTTPQDGLHGKSKPWPRGRVLGGSSAINGLYYIRQSEREQNLWAKIAGDANDLWGWENMLRALKKSENFTAPTDEARQTGEIHWNNTAHGNKGPIGVSWPAVSYPPVGAFVESAGAVSAPATNNPDSGAAWGTFVATSAINPSNWTRTTSRTGYIDPFTYRPNLQVLTDHMVSKINFDTSNKDAVKATSVNFMKKKGGKVFQVNATREVILSAGAVNDPQILQISGIGDKGLLDSKKVPVVVDLPGVGFHLQDHLSAGVEYKPKNASELPPAKLTNDARVDSFVNSATSYTNTSTLLGNLTNQVLDAARKNASKAVQAYNAPDAVKKGYNLTYTTTANDVYGTPIGAMELLFAMTFGQIQVQAALQHPFSRGSITIKSDDIFDAPIINPSYLEQDTDIALLRAGFRMARAILQQKPLSDHVSDEVHPGNNVQSDDQWDNWIRDSVGTEYHPSCTCSMLPREMGGVVDKNLLVYGTSNLRVIDAAVPPLSVSAHLMSVTYGIAEIGAEIVHSHKDDYKPGQGGDGKSDGDNQGQSNKASAGAAGGAGSSKSGNGAKGGSGSSSSGGSKTKSNGAIGTRPVTWIGVLGTGVALSLALMI
ncbi:hypothetical protein MOBT1_001779 [Malassezia obtusa]|uniref:Choline dehydrogenase n=1 Tax=Malassezia obtusa TaxID=76774 RepID=A0AAF0E0S1_9BASI|nr:hypothetical protein MOBT1_001779 [Malassezia obtusa]